MKFDILNRYSGKVQFTAEIAYAESAALSIKAGLAIKWAYANNADLRGANLGGANLGGANLGGANLRGADLGSADLREADLGSADLRSADLGSADLRGANLGGANLRYTNLRYTNLRSADLREANLRGANLREADLREANLRYTDLGGANLRYTNLRSADLREANLRSADLREANLRGANLGGANLRSFKADFWLTLTQNKAEVPALMLAIREGRINGSQYTGNCACLVGTIAKIRKVDYHKIEHNSEHPAEQWFMMIREGDKPDTCFASKQSLEWAQEWCELNEIKLP